MPKPSLENNSYLTQSWGFTSFPRVLAVRVFANGPGGLGSIPGRVIPKTQKMVLDASLLNTQHYTVWIKDSNPGKWVTPSPTLWCSSYRKGAFGPPSTMVANFTLLYYNWSPTDSPVVCSSMAIKTMAELFHRSFYAFILFIWYRAPSEDRALYTSQDLRQNCWASSEDWTQ